MVLLASLWKDKFLKSENIETDWSEHTYPLVGGPLDGCEYIVVIRVLPEDYEHILPSGEEKCQYEYDKDMNSFMFRGFVKEE
jgi:hypothetical protein